MSKLIAVAIAIVLAGLSAADAAQKSRHRRHAVQRVAEPQRQIACTVIGCVEVPRGCGQTPGKTRGGSPTGGDVIVCPPGVAPFK